VSTAGCDFGVLCTNDTWNRSQWCTQIWRPERTSVTSVCHAGTIRCVDINLKSFRLWGQDI